MRSLRGSAGWVVLSGVLGACGAAESIPETSAITAPVPEVVRIADPGLHPEGIEWDAAGQRFLVSSVTRGTVTSVHDDGSHVVFLDDADVVSSIGIHIDRANGRLLVANSDVAAFQGNPGHAKIGSYDLASGDRLFMTDLGALTPGATQFANDVTTAPDGTAYVTNYTTPAIYVVSPDGSASVLVEGEPLAPGGINGIDLHPDGYLLAAQAGSRGLIRVPLDDPSATHRVSLAEPINADGLALTPEGRLVAVAGTGEGDSSRTEVLLLESADGWESATIVERWEAAADATTAALRGDDIYVIDARFADMGGDAPHFDISRIPVR